MCYMNCMYDTDVTMTDRAMVLWSNPSTMCPMMASTIISDRPGTPRALPVSRFYYFRIVKRSFVHNVCGSSGPNGLSRY